MATFRRGARNLLVVSGYVISCKRPFLNSSGRRQFAAFSTLRRSVVPLKPVPSADRFAAVFLSSSVILEQAFPTKMTGQVELMDIQTWKEYHLQGKNAQEKGSHQRKEEGQREAAYEALLGNPPKDNEVHDESSHLKEKHLSGDSVTLNMDPITPVEVASGSHPEDHQSTDAAKVSVDLADKVSLFRGDITKLKIDAIVNAANERMLGGGGVDGAIHRAAGQGLREECEKLKGPVRCQTGDAKITGGHKLPAKHVIHTVGPRVWGGVTDEDAGLLKSCYEKSLKLLSEKGLKSIAFPCISTGIYGYPPEEAAPVAIRTVKEFLEEHKEVERVIFCVFLESDVKIYEEKLQAFFPVKSAAGKKEDKAEVEDPKPQVPEPEPKDPTQPNTKGQEKDRTSEKGQEDESTKKGQEGGNSDDEVQEGETSEKGQEVETTKKGQEVEATKKGQEVEATKKDQEEGASGADKQDESPADTAEAEKKDLKGSEPTPAVTGGNDGASEGQETEVGGKDEPEPMEQDDPVVEEVKK